MTSYARSIAAAIGAGMLVAACGGSATLETPTATPTATSTATTAATTVSAGAWTVTDKSKATIRVREQLVGVSLPSDAVLAATGAKGSFELNSDGTLASASLITFDLTTLPSDQRDRDNFINNDTRP